MYKDKPSSPGTMTYDQPQPCGVFGDFPDTRSEAGNKWIREEKFSVSFSAFKSTPYNQPDAKGLQGYGPWLLVSWNELPPQGDADVQTGIIDQLQFPRWVFENIDGIIQKWSEVLNVLDQKIDVPVRYLVKGYIYMIRLVTK